MYSMLHIYVYIRKFGHECEREMGKDGHEKGWKERREGYKQCNLYISLQIKVNE